MKHVVVGRTPTTPLPTEYNPRVVLRTVCFGDGGTPTERAAQMRKNRSILDTVAGEMARLQQTLGASDRARRRRVFRCGA